MRQLAQYVRLESGIARWLLRLWERGAEDKLRPLEIAVEREDLSEAQWLMDSIDVQSIAHGAYDGLKTHVVMSLTYGAKLGNTDNGRLRYLDRQLPEVIDDAIKHFLLSLTTAKVTSTYGVMEMIAPGTLRTARDSLDEASVEFILSQALVMSKADTSRADMLNAVVMGNAKRAIDITANLTTSRLVGLGFLEQSLSLGYGQYQITAVLDDRVCGVCQAMHGKVFDVAPARDHLLDVLRLSDTAQLKQRAPFQSATKANVARIRGMTPKQMQDAGIHAPPYHPGCRCRQVRVGNVPEAEILSVLTAAQLAEEAGEDLDT